MDDSPRGFAVEFKSAVLKKRVGQIALAVILAEGCIRFLNSLVWYLILPLISGLMNGHSESVLFRTKPTIPLEQLFGSTLEFAFVIIFVFYANRWIRNSVPKPVHRQAPVTSHETASEMEKEEPVYYHLTGEPLNPTEEGPSRK
jgi:large-conductance mechanosensitive channel